jgi:hypothetical protein
VIDVDGSHTSDPYEARQEDDEHEYRIDHLLTVFGSPLIIADFCDCGGAIGGNGSPVLEMRCFS